MKVITLVLFVLIVSAEVKQRQFNPEFLNLINTSSQLTTSMDAIKAVLQLLEDLKFANDELDRKADAAFQEYKDGVQNDCSSFTGILNENNQSLQKNSEDLEAIDDQIAQTTDYLNWNEKRRKTNDKKLEIIAEQRCEANSLFIEALRDYHEALNVLEWVNVDLQAKEANSFLQQDQLEDYSTKLQTYTQLFTPTNEILAQTQQSNEDVANQTVSEIVGKVQALISKIREHIQTLEDQEITSANDFVDFRQNLINEQAQLKQEYDGRQKFLNSLQNDIEVAQDVVNQCVAILENTQRILQQTQDTFNNQQAKYLFEKQKRHDENQIIIEIMMLYHQKVEQASQFLEKHGITL